MSTLLRKLFDIRPGEGSRALLMFLYIFSVISSLLILKPMRNSLFLTNFGAENLPYVFILVAVFAAVISTIYSRFAKRIRLHLLIRSALLFIISNLIIFWLLLYFDYQGGWFIYAFYVWVAIFAVITTSQFWTLANYVFNAREAKRLFGFVGAGAISGGIFGGYLTNYLAPLIGTNHLIFICIGLLTLCLIISQVVWGMRAQDSQTEQTRQKQQAGNFKSSSNPFK
nr:hypothetical protein [Calditrichia bacterium]